MMSPSEPRQQAVLLSFAAVVIGTACGDGTGPAAECQSDADCAPGRTCVSQRCEPVVARLDAGQSSQNAPTLDAASPDAEEPDTQDLGAEDAATEDSETGSADVGDSGGENPAFEGPNAQDANAQDANAAPGQGMPADAVCGPAACERARCDCGHVHDDCGWEVDCGQCPHGYTCANHKCVPDCTPRLCRPDECGHVDLGCGVTRDCGWCGDGQSCRDNRCVESCQCDPIEFCSHGQCVCRPLHRGIRIGDLENSSSSADWDEFGNYHDPHPTYYVDDPVWTVRPWIGHSECPTCTPGTTKRQSFVFSGLVPGVRYILAVYPSWVSGSAYYHSRVVRGSATIVGGNVWNYPGPSGHVYRDTPWFVQFVAHSSEVGLELGNGVTHGSEYLYVDRYDFAPQHPCR